MRHRVKTWPAEFEAVQAGDKTADLRRNDRDYRVGDILILAEWDPHARTVDEHQVEHAGVLTGREQTRQVSHVLDGGQFGLQPGFVMLSLRTTIVCPNCEAAEFGNSNCLRCHAEWRHDWGHTCLMCTTTEGRTHR